MYYVHVGLAIIQLPISLVIWAFSTDQVQTKYSKLIISCGIPYLRVCILIWTIMIIQKEFWPNLHVYQSTYTLSIFKSHQNATTAFAVDWGEEKYRGSGYRNSLPEFIVFHCILVTLENSQSVDRCIVIMSLLITYAC